MIGIGTIANVAAIIVGGIAGLFFRKGLRENIREMLMTVLGICVMFLGLSGALSGMLSVSETGRLEAGGTGVLIASMVIGSLIGELCGIEKGFERFGEYLKKTFDGSGTNTRFVEGFVNAVLIVCVGAMAVIGPVNDAVFRDPSTLFIKAVLDGFIVLVLASAYGKGAVFSALPLGLYQGALTALAGLIAPYLTQSMTDNLAYVGSVLVFCVGTNMCFGTKFRVANMLPAMVVSVLLGAFM